MLALDHGGSFRKIMNPEDPSSVSDEQVLQLKKQIIKALAPHVSGVLVDQHQGLPAYKELEKEGVKLPPYLSRMTEQTYGEEDGMRTTTIVHDAQEIKELGALGTKIVLYFNPYVDNAKAQIEVALQGMRESQEVNLPYFFEPVLYTTSDEEEGRRKEVMLEMTKMLVDAGVDAEAWKVEYPGDKEHCEKFNELVKGKPWILLTRGTTYDVFLESVRVAAQYGAKGFLAGRALWQEVGELEGEERRVFIEETLPKRLKTLTSLF